MAKKTPGERIKAVREALGFKQYEFAKILGIRGPSLSELESGESAIPKGDTLHRMILAGANPEFIMEGKGPMLIFDAERALDPDEQALLATLKGMTSENKRHLIEIAKTLRKAQAEESDESPNGSRQ